MTDMLVREDDATAIRPADGPDPGVTIDTSTRAPAGGSYASLRVFRGEADGPTRYDDFAVPVEEGMVVLDALHWIQGHASPTSPSAGTARPRSAGPAVPRSMASRG